MRLSDLASTPVFESYWRFAAERQAVFFRRVRGEPPPWTDDEIIRRYKFTNAYRAADRVSQYLIREVIYAGDQDAEETLFRILLFKTFNQIETWELLAHKLGAISYRGFDYDRCDRVLREARDAGKRIYSGAYIMPSGRSSFGSTTKHRNHLKLLRSMMTSLPGPLARAQSLGEVFALLLDYPTIGPFLAYQYATDINYSELIDFDEDSFVAAGPGAIDGVAKCFADLSRRSADGVIRLVADVQEREFERRGLNFQSLWGRRLKLIDCQNLFCEISKYARVAHPELLGKNGRSKIKQQFRQTPAAIDFWFPPKWGINQLVERDMGNVADVAPAQRSLAL